MSCVCPLMYNVEVEMPKLLLSLWNECLFEFFVRKAFLVIPTCFLILYIENDIKLLSHAFLKYIHVYAPLGIIYLHQLSSLGDTPFRGLCVIFCFNRNIWHESY